MNCILKNELLTVTLSTKGAELISVKRGDCEYIWQGDPTFWSGQAPLMFPICGRFFETSYSHAGKTYQMGTHGFLRSSETELIEASDTEATFALSANDSTRAQYPFDFALTVTYRLQGERLSVLMTVRNTGDEVLPATVGGHPGFNVPLDGTGGFGDWYLEFCEACSPDEVLMTPTCFLTGKRRGYPLQDGKRLPLSHDLFAVDAIFLSRISDSVTLKSQTGKRSVTLHYPQMPYLGIWHAPRTEAPYVCIEPWCGLPAYDQTVEEIGEKPDMFRLEPGTQKEVAFSIEFR